MHAMLSAGSRFILFHTHGAGERKSESEKMSSDYEMQRVSYSAGVGTMVGTQLNKKQKHLSPHCCEYVPSQATSGMLFSK